MVCAKLEQRSDEAEVDHPIVIRQGSSVHAQVAERRSSTGISDLQVRARCDEELCADLNGVNLVRLRYPLSAQAVQ